MLKVSLKGLWAHKRRFAATVSAVLLGVAFLAATLAFTDSMRAGIDESFTKANAGIDAVVRSELELGSEEAAQRGTIDLALLPTVESVDGVARAVPLVEGNGQVVGADGAPVGGNGPPTMALSWIDDEEINGYHLLEGRAPAAVDEVVIDRRTAEAGDLQVGDRTTVLFPQPVELTIAGIAGFLDDDQLGGATYAALTLEAAQQHLLGDASQVTSFVVVGDPGVSPEELTARLDRVLPAGIESITGAELTAEQNQEVEDGFVSFFEAFLLVFAAVALLVGTFSIYNTFSIIVAQRTRESALLRALGASRRQVLGSIALEAVVVGAIASALGLAAGFGLARGLLVLLSETDFGVADRLVIETGTVVTAVTVGMIVTMVASLAPAVRASRVAPLAALRDAAIDRTDRAVWRTVTGLLATAGGASLVVMASGSDGDDALANAGLGALICVVGAVLLGPVIGRVATAVLGAPIAALRGVTGGLARRNAMRNPRRTAATASALMVGVGVVTLFTVFAASLRTGIDDAVSESFTGDLVIEQTSFSGAGMSPALAEELASLDEVEAVTGFGIGAVQLAAGTSEPDVEEPSVVDPAALAQVMDLDVQEGSIADLTPTQLAVSTRWAEDEGVSLGDELAVGYADGASERFTVGAVYERSEIVGDVLLPEAAWMPHARQPMHVVVALKLADGVDVAAGRRAVEAVAERHHAPEVQDADEYIDSVTAEVDQVLALVYGLLALAIVIALMGIANTLSLAVHERTRELGLLRAIGQSRGQTRAMVRWESVVVAVFGTASGVGLGVFLGWGLTRAVAAQEGIGSFTAPVGQLAVVLVLGAIVGVVAGFRPARRAAKLRVIDALAV